MTAKRRCEVAEVRHRYKGIGGCDTDRLRYCRNAKLASEPRYGDQPEKVTLTSWTA